MSTVSTAPSAIKPVPLLKNFSSCFFQTSTVSIVEYKKNLQLMFNFLLSTVSMAPSANRPASLLKYFSSCFFKCQQCQLWNTNKNGWCIIFCFMSFWKNSGKNVNISIVSIQNIWICIRCFFFYCISPLTLLTSEKTWRIIFQMSYWFNC